MFCEFERAPFFGSLFKFLRIEDAFTHADRRAWHRQFTI